MWWSDDYTHWTNAKSPTIFKSRQRHAWQHNHLFMWHSTFCTSGQRTRRKCQMDTRGQQQYEQRKTHDECQLGSSIQKRMGVRERTQCIFSGSNGTARHAMHASWTLESIVCCRWSRKEWCVHGLLRTFCHLHRSIVRRYQKNDCIGKTKAVQSRKFTHNCGRCRCMGG